MILLWETRTNHVFLLLFRILSDPAKRQEYHRLGEQAAADDTLMEPKALFALMFSDFDHIVGDLATARILSTPDQPTEGEENANASADSAGSSTGAGPQSLEEKEKHAKEARERRKKFQKARVAYLAELLNRRLEPWMAGDEEAFIKHAKHEVFAMRDEPFGREVLKTAGYVYGRRASRFLEKKKGPLHNVQSMLDNLGDKAHQIKNHVRAFEGGVKVLSSVNAEENETIDDKARRDTVNILGVVWLSSVLDIESTLKHVVSAVLHVDETNPKPIAKKKAAGLIVLSKIFEQA